MVEDCKILGWQISTDQVRYSIRPTDKELINMVDREKLMELKEDCQEFRRMPSCKT